MVAMLKERQLKLALAESVSGGMAADKLCSIPGTSGYFAGSVVCYSPEVKVSLLRISKQKIDRHTCESKEITALLAKHLTRLMEADVYGAITGLASPGGSETKQKPVGTVFICVLYKGKLHHARHLFRGRPKEIREKACEALYGLVVQILNAH